MLIGGVGNTPTDTGVKVPRCRSRPRFDIAYRATEKTVIRAGYGISIDPDTFRYMRDSYPATVSSQFNAPSALGSSRLAANRHPGHRRARPEHGAITIPKTVGTVTWPEEYRRGYFQSFNFTLQRDIGAGFNLQTSYVGTRAIRQTARWNINYWIPGRRHRTGRVLARKWGRTADVTMYTPFNTTNYNGWQNQLNRQLRRKAGCSAVVTPGRSRSHLPITTIPR